MDYDGALADLSQAITWDSYFVNAYLNRGTAYHRMGRLREAIVDFSRVIELAPDNGEAFYTRGNAKLGLNDSTGACADWHVSLSLGRQQAAQPISTSCPS
jgi:tetratricopeptide (TPR) repeat protein